MNELFDLGIAKAYAGIPYCNVWGGVGKMPKWFKEQLDKGVDKETMLIPS